MNIYLCMLGINLFTLGTNSGADAVELLYYSLHTISKKYYCVD